MNTEGALFRPAQAGLTYAILVFAVGVALGTVRVLIVMLRLGAALAVLLETPLILGASWWLSRRCIARFQLARAAAARLIMGLVAPNTW